MQRNGGGPSLKFPVYLQSGGPVIEHDDGSPRGKDFKGRSTTSHWKGVKYDVRYLHQPVEFRQTYPVPCMFTRRQGAL